MGQGNAKSDATASNVVDDNNEIDRIMKEIEDLEHDLSSAPEVPTEPSQSAKNGNDNALQDNETVLSDSAETTMNTEIDSNEAEEPKSEDNVIQMKPKSGFDAAFEETVDTGNEDSGGSTENGYSEGNGNLSLKVGGLTSIYLEFERAGLTVSFECTDSALIIKTDQGAEFKVPFSSANYSKKAA